MSGKRKDNKNVFHRMDVVWDHMGQIKTPDGNLMFEKLSLIALPVLSHPYSNTDEEQIFRNDLLTL